MPKRSVEKSRKGAARLVPPKKRPFRTIVIVGVGLIGGSIGMAVRKKRLADTVIGVGPREDELKRAVAKKAIDAYATDDRDVKKAVEKADLVILAAPVGRLETAARDLSAFLPKNAMVTDVGSVKGSLVRRLEDLFSPEASGRSRFVGGHPIAGRETSGVESSMANLFSGALCILTPTDRTDPKALATVKQFWQAIGARAVSMDPDAHDRVLACVSHLPHLVAYALVNTVLDLQSKNGDLLSYTGGGFRDFTRIAASSPEMWRDISLFNRENLLSVIEAFEMVLNRLKRMMVEGNGEGLRREFERAKAVKDPLK